MGGHKSFWLTTVYSRSKVVKRRKIWNKLRPISSQATGPCDVCGDFNSIMTSDEKKGGTQHRLSQSFDSITCMEEYGLTDAGYTGTPFTWCNGWKKGRRISKRVEMVLFYEEWAELFSTVRVDNLPRTGSDHNVMLMQNNIGNVHDKVQEMEEITKHKEDEYECDDLDDKRQAYHKAQAYVVRERRKKACLHKIRDRDGDWIEGENEIAEAAIDHFRQIFTQYNNSPDLSITDLYGKVISDEDNDRMQESPTEEEINEAVFSMDPNSAAGPDGLATLLPNIISENQSGFVRGRLIIENIVLTQEIVQGIRKHNQRENVMGFSYGFIEMVYRLISNNWYSIIRFKARGPTFPALFIIAAEINRLCYTYDLVTFTSGDRRSIKMIMYQLSEYQLASGQEINRDKSQFYTQEGTESHIRRRNKRWTGYKQANFPFIYLGYTIYTGRKKICHYTEISNKVMNKVEGWQGRFLSKGGKEIIIKHILRSQTIHLLAAPVPPKAVLDQIEMYFSNFFWGQRDGKNNYHWSSWGKMCYPVEERGRWCRLRTEYTLWAKFMEAKYCIRSNILSRGISPTDSMAWNHLVKIRDKVEDNIIWKINEGNLLFWWDDWTSQGSIKKLLDLSSRPRSTKVKEFIVGNEWNLELIGREAPERVVNIIQCVSLRDPMARDLAIWKPSTDRRFSCATAFQALRQKGALTFSVQGTLNHVFGKGDMAKKVCEVAARPLGIHCGGNTVKLDGQMEGARGGGMEA
ncbi:putative ribonuclease h protein [Nicotiana attenuata]|uniref:Ribonuclease h protein n=1 Tax=Nicotiana attenuata TaxID=49451 RepID=A0A1J6IZS3_NICAT|nr:putative ribonuclease h protein [Nicotiana attenuata]